MGKKKNETLVGVLFILPSIIGFIAFSAGPMIASFVLSFTNYSITRPFEFIGAENYLNYFQGNDPFFYNSLKVTIIFALMNVPVCIGTAFIIAMLLNSKNLKGLSALRSMFYVPTIVPIIATAMIFMWMMSPDFGLFNAVLEIFGIPPSKWIYSEKTVLPSLLIMTAWGSGNIMVVFLAGLQSIPTQLYEATVVDGGNAFTKFRHVTLPMMTPTIFFNTLMFLISSMQAFLQAYIMTKGGPNNATNFLVYNLYREAFEFGEIGKANSLGWILFVMIAAVSALLFWSSKYWVFYGDE
ncbi:carbohydrate ABC transporter permease [Breznakiella homolactica]|uniref:Sugar ABC transporter permease n=1 Tax=Breznakiella homolactica TaxID=2798577 RepID=A0A7T7XK05_9SPIR|nr:sugar ABC transporter permease [Breznakiella homolactica]QQO07830.1 sugar ABC transporter permease [Breznakiella homolactica]